MRDLEVEQDARDLDIFLSDHWNFYKILRFGGVVFVFGDEVFAVDRSLLMPGVFSAPAPALPDSAVPPSHEPAE